jgi:beta-lactamase regulating signal transducer with metallopeptidase domain
MNTIEACFRSVLVVSCYGAFLIGGLLLIRSLVGRRCWPSLLFTAWVIVFVRLLAAVSFELIPALPVRPVAPVQRFTPSSLRSPVPVTAAQDASDLTASPSAHDSNSYDIVRFAAGIWFAGVALLFVWRMFQFYRVREIVAGAVPVEGPWLAATQRLAGDLGVKAPAVRCSANVDSPCLTGMIRPVLLIPDHGIRIGDEERDFVLRHELSHLKARHLFAAELMYAAAALHWFNPLVWIAQRLARVDCEIACDAAVLRQSEAGAFTAYGLALLHFSKGRAGKMAGCRPGLSAVSSAEALMERMKFISSFEGGRRSFYALGRAMNVALAVVALTSLALAADAGPDPAGTKSSGAEPSQSTDLVIGLETDGRMTLDGKPVSLAQLKAALLQAKARAGKNAAVSIKPDSHVAVDQLTELLNTVRRCGISRVQLRTRVDADDARAPRTGTDANRFNENERS